MSKKDFVVLELQNGLIWERNNIDVTKARYQAEAAIRKARGEQ